MGDHSPNNVNGLNYLKGKVESIFGINLFLNDKVTTGDSGKVDDNCSPISDSINNNNGMHSNVSEPYEGNDTLESHLQNRFDSQELPTGSTESEILDECMIRQMMEILPLRAIAYAWVHVYSTALHGFSLATLYRKMDEWEVDMSPMLLLVNDMDGNVFGAFTSSKVRHSERYYGTGDSTFLFRFTRDVNRRLETYRWTGLNDYFICSPLEFFAMGGGDGVFGLWLDADLNLGQSRKCDTFNNEPLAGNDTDVFSIRNVEKKSFGYWSTIFGFSSYDEIPPTLRDKKIDTTRNLGVFSHCTSSHKTLEKEWQRR